MGMNLTLKNLAYANDLGMTVLEDLSMTLEYGETVGITGRNGSGKTTLLHLIMGFLKAAKGSICVEGNELRLEKEFQAMRGATLGILFQNTDDQLFCPTVEEEIAFGPLNLKHTIEEVEEIVSSILRRVGLEGFEKRVPQKLSGGEKRLVALASVLSASPRYLLLDEPTAGLDSEARSKLVQVLKDVDAAILMVTHDENLLKSMCDRRFLLEHGRLTVIDENDKEDAS